MIHKSGKWFADWRDENGIRRRKAFRTKATAASFQRRMQAQTTTKKAQASAPRAQSSKHGPRPQPRPNEPRPVSSPKPSARCRPGKSRRSQRTR